MYVCLYCLSLNVAHCRSRQELLSAWETYGLLGMKLGTQGSRLHYVTTKLQVQLPRRTARAFFAEQISTAALIIRQPIFVFVPTVDIEKQCGDGAAYRYLAADPCNADMIKGLRPAATAP